MDLKIKSAIFWDKVGELQHVIIMYHPGVLLEMDCYNENGESTGYMRLHFHPNNRLYLDVIYCYDKFRGRGIATQLSNLADYFLQGYSGYIIRGVYMPGQLSTDRQNRIDRSFEELDMRASCFYRKNGYEIVSLEEYYCDPSRYSNIDIENDFRLGEELARKIVIKQVEFKDKCSFLVDDEIMGQDDLSRWDYKILQRKKGHERVKNL